MDAFIGEIRLMAIGYQPQAWILCDGRELAVVQYQALFSLIGNKWGGTANQTFKLPDLRTRVVVGAGNDPVDDFDPAWGSSGGLAAVPLTVQHVPPHSHLFNATSALQAQLVATGGGNWLANAAYTNGSAIENARAFTPLPATGAVTMQPNTLTPFAGGSAAHENRQPTQALGYFICAVDGVYPTRN